MKKDAATIRVLIVDDSALIRQLLTEIINDSPTSRWWAPRPIRSWRAT